MNQTVAPDIGHSALAVTDQNGETRTYASFWPERDSLIGKITQLWKHRQARCPGSYMEEIDPEQGYMQREADHADEIFGLDEAVAARLWEHLCRSKYDFLKWNCASVCKLIILGSASARDESVKDFALSASALAQLSDPDHLLAALQELSTSPAIVSHPEELRHLAEAYAIAS